MKKRPSEIKDYDDNDTTPWINPKKPMRLSALGLKLPPVTPTQVVSIRLPTSLLNRIRANASTQDIPYQALIKHLLAKAVHHTT